MENDGKLQNNAKTHITLAIEAYRKTLQIWTLDNSPDRYGNVQFNIGTCYYLLYLVTTDVKQCWNALDALKQALHGYSINNRLQVCARIQYNIGVIHKTLARVLKSQEHYQDAISELTNALNTFDPATHTKKVLETHLRLGESYSALVDKEGVTHLERAIQHYESARQLFPEKDTSEGYHRTLINLSRVYFHLGMKNGSSQNFQEAIRNLTEIIPEITSPKMQAQAQYILGNEYYFLAEVVDPETNYKHAIKAYQETLQVYTAQTYPTKYEIITRNLTLARKLLEIEISEI